MNPSPHTGLGKAHAASYGKVAYQTSYMKANYPVEYLAAVLTADSGDTEQIAVFVAEAKRMGINVLPAGCERERDSVHRRTCCHTRTPLGNQGESLVNAIRFGLSSIKNFGDGISETIINERKERGPFKTLSDFSHASDRKISIANHLSHLLSAAHSILSAHQDAHR